MSWIYCGRERLFTSPRAIFQPKKAIRGGIPVIFPQFGDHGLGLRHGFARLLAWTPVTASADRAILLLGESEETLHFWPHRFRAELEVRLEEGRLSTSLAVTNLGDSPLEFTAALHTYLRVSDIAQAAIFGLQNRPYLDAADAGRLGQQSEAMLRIVGEVDRIYPGSGTELTLHDSAGPLEIRSTGFTDTVVWNPGEALAATLGDLGTGNHAHFVCVEAANVQTPIRLAPSAGWRGGQTLSCRAG